MTDSVIDQPKVDAVIERYIALRDRKTQLKAEFDEATKPIDAGLAKVETYLLARMQETGSDSFKTPFGTAYSTTKTFTSVADWTAVLDWVRTTENWALLTHGVSKDFVKLFKDEHNDLPPGVNWREEIAVNVRKPT